MPIQHKFQKWDFGNGFQTKNSILSAPYNPEVMFIGTFNHGVPWNPSDFFYGRGMYMWTILANLFIHNRNYLESVRTSKNNEPTYQQLFRICTKGKIGFADIVKGIKPNIPTRLCPVTQLVFINNAFHWQSYKDTMLNQMGRNGWLEDNTAPIIDFINRTRSIRHIYFTFKSGVWLNSLSGFIVANVRPGVTLEPIFTPTGNGFRKNLLPPFENRPSSIAHCWVWNALAHPNPVHKVGYGHLDHYWLQSKGVKPSNF